MIMLPKFHFIMVKQLKSDGEDIARIFAKINAAAGNNLPYYTPLEGGDYTGPRYVLSLPADIDYYGIFEREGFIVERVKEMEDVDMEKCNPNYEVTYCHGSFKMWRVR